MIIVQIMYVFQGNFSPHLRMVFTANSIGSSIYFMQTNPVTPERMTVVMPIPNYNPREQSQVSGYSGPEKINRPHGVIQPKPMLQEVNHFTMKSLLTVYWLIVLRDILSMVNI